MRRSPKQERAQETIEVILTATARVLVRDGFGRLTTNRVAQVAGVSIGSLYQYFPNKQSLVAALYERHLEDLTALFRARIAELVEAPLSDGLRQLVAATIDVHAREPELHAVLVEHGPRMSQSARTQQLEGDIFRLIRAYLEEHRSLLRTDDIDLDLATFVVVNAVESVVHAATLQRSPHLQEGTLLDELTMLLTRYLAPQMSSGESRSGGLT